jgi:hypothetical protein
VNTPTPPNLAKTTQLVLGIVFLTLGVVLLAVGGIQLALYLSGAAHHLTLEPIAIPVGLAFAIPGGLRLRRYFLDRQIELHGTPAEADLLSVEHTKAEVEGHPVVRLHLRVYLAGEAPYEVRIRWTMRPLDGTRLVPGRRVNVKVHPRSRREVALA